MSRFNADYKEIKQWADYYYQIRLNVIPLNKNKKPLVKWDRWKRERMPKREFNWLFRSRACSVKGLGVILGASRLVCLDFETKNLYREYTSFLQSRGLEFPTWISETKRGFHVFFVCDHEIRQLHIQDLFEILCDDHYAVLPPTLHPKGGTYQWIVSPKEVSTPSTYPEEVIEEFCKQFVLPLKPITENNITEKNRRITENKDKETPLESTEEKSSFGDFTPFFYDFEYLKDCFKLFGFRDDVKEWNLNQMILCVHHPEKNPSAKFVKMKDDKIGYTEFHSPVFGTKTYLGSFALVAHFLNRFPEENTPEEKYYFVLRGMRFTKEELQAEGVVYQSSIKLKELLTTLETERSLMISILRTYLTIHVFEKGNGEDLFFISSRDLSSICRLDNHVMGNRILNLLCLLGFLDKQTVLEPTHKADRYKISKNPVPDFDMLQKLKPLDNLNQINKKTLQELGFVKDKLDNTFRRKINSDNALHSNRNLQTSLPLPNHLKRGQCL